MSDPLVLCWRARPVPIVLRWRGFDDAAAAAIEEGADPAALAAIVGAPGRAGADGGAAQISSVVDADILAGTPLVVSRSTGHLIVAAASFKPTAFVAGLAREDTAAGFVADAAVDELALDDWTAITGAATLSPGLSYFLGSAGRLTTVPPGSPDCVALVGWAANATTLVIDPQPPIQL